MSLKSWGLELWDQVDKVFQYSNQGLEQIELFYRTVSDIHKIYVSLGKKYRAIVGPTTSAKSKLVLENSSYNSGFNKFISCMNDQASIYDTHAEEIREKVMSPVKIFIDLFKSTIITQNNEYAKCKTNLENNKRILDRTWSKYYQAFVNKKRAEANYQKIKDDKAVPRNDIERVQSVSNTKSVEFEKMRGEYASQLQQFNNARSLLYLHELPKLCSELEIFDRRRAEVTTDVGIVLASIQKKHLEKTGECNNSMDDAVRIIDYRSDAAALLLAYKSPIMFPPDIVFVDLDKCKGDAFHAADFPGILQQGGKIEKNDSAKSLFGGIGMKGIEAKEMLGEQVKLRLDEVGNTIKQVEKKLSGIKVLQDTYEKNPAMGDKASVLHEIDVNERQLASLHDMTDVLGKYSHYPTGGRSSTISKKEVPVSTVVDSDGSFDEDEEEDFDGQPEVSPASANMARVLYDFEPTDSQQLEVTTDMTVKVLTYDDSGSGWTLVQNMKNPNLKGYVPTNYIKMA